MEFWNSGESGRRRLDARFWMLDKNEKTKLWKHGMMEEWEKWKKDTGY
jgi:hypothetical protein